MPENYKETFVKLSEYEIYSRDFAKKILKSVGKRNILIHEYDKVDYSSIYDSIKDCLRDYHKYCDYILDFVD